MVKFGSALQCNQSSNNSTSKGSLRLLQYKSLTLSNKKWHLIIFLVKMIMGVDLNRLCLSKFGTKFGLIKFSYI